MDGLFFWKIHYEFGCSMDKIYGYFNKRKKVPAFILMKNIL